LSEPELFILFGLKEKQHKFVTLKLAEVGVAKSYKLL
jgi:hypothetical protein